MNDAALQSAKRIRKLLKHARRTTALQEVSQETDNLLTALGEGEPTFAITQGELDVFIQETCYPELDAETAERLYLSSSLPLMRRDRGETIDMVNISRQRFTIPPSRRPSISFGEIPKASSQRQEFHRAGTIRVPAGRTASLEIKFPGEIDEVEVKDVTFIVDLAVSGGRRSELAFRMMVDRTELLHEVVQGKHRTSRIYLNPDKRYLMIFDNGGPGAVASEARYRITFIHKTSKEYLKYWQELRDEALGYLDTGANHDYVLGALEHIEFGCKPERLAKRLTGEILVAVSDCLHRNIDKRVPLEVLEEYRELLVGDPEMKAEDQDLFFKLLCRHYLAHGVRYFLRFFHLYRAARSDDDADHAAQYLSGDILETILTTRCATVSDDVMYMHLIATVFPGVMATDGGVAGAKNMKLHILTGAPGRSTIDYLIKAGAAAHGATVEEQQLVQIFTGAARPRSAIGPELQYRRNFKFSFQMSLYTFLAMLTLLATMLMLTGEMSLLRLAAATGALALCGAWLLKTFNWIAALIFMAASLTGIWFL